jgi:hypothetical protein
MATERKKKIIIAGGSGFIGTKLAEKFENCGYEVVILTRTPKNPRANSSIRFVGWDGKTPGDWFSEIEDSQAVLNLAGKSIAGETLPGILFGRWTQKYKQEILQSRVSSGNVLAEAVLSARKKPQVFIQASGIGFYGTSSATPLDEESPPGSDFLASVSLDWEDSSRGVTVVGIRHAVIRSGVVLDPGGGILPLVALPIRLFLGGRLGNGRQPFPWIHIEDEIAAIQFLIEDKSCNGAFNLVAPGIASNAEFGKILAAVLRRPFYLPVPAFLLKLLLGEKSILVLAGQQAVPRKLLDAGFTFHHPQAESALKDLYRRRTKDARD